MSDTEGGRAFNGHMNAAHFDGVARDATVRENSFSGVLLSGGKSRRMGTEKPALIVKGEPLWRRQWRTLGTLGLRECFLSAPLDAPWLDGTVTPLPDEHPGAGPLAGLATALATMTSDWLVALAVDLPLVSPALLRLLIDEAADGCGVVPWVAGFPQPLAAVYPRAAGPIAQRRLQAGARALRGMLEELESSGRMRRFSLPPELESQLTNLNTPEDYARLQAHLGT